MRPESKGAKSIDSEIIITKKNLKIIPKKHRSPTKIPIDKIESIVKEDTPQDVHKYCYTQIFLENFFR